MTVSEELERIDSLVQLAVISCMTDVAELRPSDGDRDIVPSPTTAGWSGQDGLAIMDG